MSTDMQIAAGRVAVFVDYRNLWHNLQSYFTMPASPQDVLRAILQEAKKRGTDEQDLRALMPFIRTMESLEGRLPFVGLTCLRDTIVRPGLLTDDSRRGRQALVSDLISRGILETHLEENPGNPQYPTTAVRLNREHPMVRSALESQDLPDSG